jgi:ribosome-associated protein
MQAEDLLKIVQDVLDERKGNNITTLDVRGKTSFTDYMVVVTGTSDRHLSHCVIMWLKKSKNKAIDHLVWKVI